MSLRLFQVLQRLSECPVLVVGAGGIGKLVFTFWSAVSSLVALLALDLTVSLLSPLCSCRLCVRSGCEVLALLCQCGFRKIQVLDLDIVAVSNLHRQFLFRDEHVGLAKAQVAADSIARRFGHLGVDVRA